MNNLVDILVAVSVVVIIISIWAIYYFIGRIIACGHRWEDDNMPSPEELHERYEQMNEQNVGDQHPR